MVSDIDHVDELLGTYKLNHKQALKECDKKLKKQPRNVYLIYWRSELLVHLGNSQEAEAYCNNLCERNPPPTDSRLLERIYGLSCRIQRSQGKSINTVGSAVLVLFQNVEAELRKNKVPASKNVYAWLMQAAAANDCWSNVQLACSKLRRQYPDERKHYFSYVASSQISGERLQLVEPTMAKLNRDLAYKCLQTSLKQTEAKPKSAEALASGRELRLLCQIYRRQGRIGELIEVLFSAGDNLKAIVDQNDVEVSRQMLTLLEEDGQWRKLFDLGMSLLNRSNVEKPEQKDAPKSQVIDIMSEDWKTWRSTVKAAKQLDDQSLNLAFQKFYDLNLDGDDKVKKRVASLTGPRSLETVNVEFCKQYWRNFATYNACFTDLKPFLEDLGENDANEFLATIEHRGGIKQDLDFKSFQTALNSLKVLFLLRVSSKAVQSEIIEKFVCDCLSLFRVAHGRKISSAIDACSLAIHGLILLHKAQPVAQTQAYVLQAAALLRWIEKDMDQSEYQDRVLLLLSIRLHMYLGISSIAVSIYPKTRIKEVLNDTLSHHLYSRISTQRIHQAKTVQASNIPRMLGDPKNALEMTLGTYNTTLNKVDLYKGKKNEFIQYDQLIEIYDLGRDLKNSVVRRMAMVDSRRICRLRAEQSQRLESDQENSMDSVYIADHRDNFLPQNFNHSSKPRLEEQLSDGPKPGRGWLSVFEMADEVESLLRTEQPLKRTVKNGVDDAASKLSQTSLHDGDLTPAELAAAEAWKILHSLALSILSSGSVSSIPSYLAALTAWLDARREALFSADEPTFDPVFRPSVAQPCASLPWSSALHCIFLHLEVLRAAHRLCDVALAAARQKGHRTAGKVPRDAVARVQAAVQASYDELRVVVTARVNALGDGGAANLVDQMREGRTGEVLVGVMGGVASSFLRETAAVYVDAAKDTLDGVLAVKLKTVV